MNKNDERFRETEKYIRTAFFELLEKRGYDHFNVMDICQKAGIGRTTFYYHYLSKEDLVGKIEDDLLENVRRIELKTTPDWIRKNGLKEGNVPHSDVISKYLADHGKELTLLMSENGDPTFEQRLYQTIRECWHLSSVSEYLNLPEEYVAAGLGGLEFGLIQAWVKRGFRESQQEFDAIVHTFSDALYPVVFNK